jgi:hypothetical protein
MPELKNMRLRAPCADCPFRTDVCRFLDKDRYAEIAESIIDRGENFTCHKHNDFDEHGKAINNDRAMTCAGSMIFLQNVGKPNTMMQVMERLGAFDPSKLRMDSPVYKTRRAFERGLKEKGNV